MANPDRPRDSGLLGSLHPWILRRGASRLLQAGTVALAVVAAAPAMAGVHVATFTGTLQYGVDDTGIFGARGSLTSATYSTSFTYDTSLGLRSGACCNEDLLDGGTVLGIPSPIISASITINGLTYAFSPVTRGQARTSPSFTSTPNVSYSATTTGTAGPLFYVDATFFDGGWPTSPNSLDQNVPDTMIYRSEAGGFQIVRYDASTNKYPVSAVGDYAGPATFSITGVDAVHDGLSAATPLLPGTTTAAGFGFTFAVIGGATVFIDPALAAGYDYRVTSGPNILSAIFPLLAGDNDGYDVFGWDAVTGLYDLALGHAIGGTIFNFGGTGVDRFGLRGIAGLAGLDPGDSAAFVTGLTFATSGPVHVEQKPFVGSAVPESSSWLLMLSGFFLIGTWVRRGQRAGVDRTMRSRNPLPGGPQRHCMPAP